MADDGRIDLKSLKATDKIKSFKNYFKEFKSKIYDASEGYATIGYGY